MKTKLSISGLFALALSFNALAATTADGYIDMTGGTAYTTPASILPNRSGNDVFGEQDGFYDATLSFNATQNYIATYLGKEAGNTNWFLTTDNGTIFSTDGSSSIGDTSIISGADISTLAFGGSGTTLGGGIIFSFISGNVLTLGFNDGGGSDSDYDDIVVSLQAVPIPAAAFMFAPALLGFMGLRRKAKNAVA
jgi:hypothetical protein